MWNKQRQTKSPPPFYRVVALGGSGSGKTVLLASMFHEMSMLRQAQRSYRITTATADAIQLNQIRSEVANTETHWPPGTRVGELREFLFTFEVNGHGTPPQRTFQISYIDYAGELHEKYSALNAKDLETLDHHIANAHALFCVLDGRQVTDYLRGEPSGHTYMSNTVTPLISRLTAATCPIHFVLTKWDLIKQAAGALGQNNNTLLAHVVGALRSHPDLSGLLQATAAGGQSVRLIPVSAIGDDFAELDNQGEMVKIPGALTKPYNLDVPLSAVLPDLFDQLRPSLSHTDLENIRGSRVTSPSVAASSILKALSTGAVAAIETALRLHPASAIAGATMSLFFDWVVGPAAVGASLKSQNTTTRTASTMARRDAEVSILGDFHRRMSRFELEFPSSRLTHV